MIFIFIILSDSLSDIQSRIFTVPISIRRTALCGFLEYYWGNKEIKDQYFMEIRSTVLEILQEGRGTGRNVERKTRIFVNFEYESSENDDKKSVLLFLSVGK